MDHSTDQALSQSKSSLIRLSISVAGIAFILIGLSITIILAIAGYNFVSEPEQFATLMDYAKTQESLFAKWATTGDIKSIELSKIFSILIIVIAISMILRVIISFISMCIESGRTLLNLSRNFE
jgi:hypothetical protein